MYLEALVFHFVVLIAEENTGEADERPVSVWTRNRPAQKPLSMLNSSVISNHSVPFELYIAVH